MLLGGQRSELPSWAERGPQVVGREDATEYQLTKSFETSHQDLWNLWAIESFVMALPVGKV